MRGEVFIDLKRDAVGVDVLSEIHPRGTTCFLAISHLPKEHNVRSDFGIRVLLERGLRQPDRADEISLLDKVLPQAGVGLVQRSFRRDECDQSTWPNVLDGFSEEVVVNQKVAVVELRVVQFVITEWDVRDRKIEGFVRQDGALVALCANVRVRIKSLCNCGSHRIDFNAAEA